MSGGNREEGWGSLTPLSPVQWTKPEPGWVKLNVDGSHDHIGRLSTGCGGVLRDCWGTWLHGFAQKLDPNCEIDEAETQAMLKGLELAWKMKVKKQMNIEKLVMESDSESVVKLVENGCKSSHPQFDLITQIRQLRYKNEWQVMVKHIPNGANRVADRLAKDARQLSSYQLVEYNDPPYSCIPWLEKDAQGVSSSDGNSSGGDSEEGWGSKFLKMAGAVAATAAVAGGVIAFLASSSSNSEPVSAFGSRAPRVTKEPGENENPWSLTDPSPPVQWTKPDFGWVKLNVDGSHDHINLPKSTGCGGVFRDSSGKWVHGFAQRLQDPTFGIHEAEIQAILKGLELAWEMNVEKVVVESDRESVVKMVENGCKYNDPQFGLISQIRQLRFDSKWQVKVVHVHSDANRVAHRLANNARAFSSYELRKYPDPPDNCIRLLSEDARGRGYY